MYNNQSFRGSPLPQFSTGGGRGYFFRAISQRGKKNIRKSSNKAGFEECAFFSGNSVSSGSEARSTSTRQKKFTSDPQILELMEGYEIPFSSESKQTKSPKLLHLTKNEKSLVDLEIQGMLQKGAIPMVEKSQNHLQIPIFFVDM